MLCPTCKTDVAAGTAFCPECGTRMPQAAAPLKVLQGRYELTRDQLLAIAAGAAKKTEGEA